MEKMKTTMQSAKLLALILMGTTAMAGCSSFKSPSAEYVQPGELCTDVSDLPDPNAPPKSQSDPLATLANQYGIGGRRDESPERLLMQADSYFEQKRYHDSARLYKKYLTLADLSTASPELLGLIHYRIGYVAAKKTFHSEAKREFIQALQFAPLENEYLFAYAKACYDAGEYQEADKQFTALLARAPGYPEANRYYGMTLLEGSNRASAIQPLTTAVGALEAYRLLADKYYEVGELELAAQTESLAIQIAAQTAQPVPNFPHKEQLLVNAQNATYAQTLNAMNAAQAAPNATPGATHFVSQYASPVATPGASPAPQFVAQLVAQPAVQPAERPVVQPVQAPTPVVAPTIAPQTDFAPPVQVEIPSQTVEPDAVASNAPVVPQNSVPSYAQSTPVAPPTDPVAAQSNSGQSVRYASVAPAPVMVADALQGQFPAFVETPGQSAETLDKTPSEPPYFDDIEEWDDSAFATSGPGYLPAASETNAPLPEAPTVPELPSVTPDEREQTPDKERPQYQSIQPTFAGRATSEETFAFALSRVAALENVARFADEAEMIVPRQNLVGRPRLVGYLAPAALEERGTTLAQNVQERPNATVATQLPPTPTEDAVRFSEDFEEAAPQDGVRMKKRAIKTNADVGRGNPGLFVSTAATKRVEIARAFRPGSIAESNEIDQNLPDEFAVLFAQQEKRREAASVDARNRDEEWTKLANRADALAQEYAVVDQNALAYYEPIYLEFGDAREIVEEVDEWDDSAFATSGDQSKTTLESVPEVGGFGDYAPPTEDIASRTEPVYVAQLTEIPAPQVPMQQVPTQQVPMQQVPMQQVPMQQVPTQQVPMQQVPMQQVPTQQVPMQQVPTQLVPTQQVPMQQVPMQQVPMQQVPMQQVPTQQVPMQQVPTQQVPMQQIPIQQDSMRQVPAQQVPVAQSTRSQTTPEERLEAARRAGAEIVELSPDQYRRAVTAGLGQQPR